MTIIRTNNNHFQNHYLIAEPVLRNYCSNKKYKIIPIYNEYTLNLYLLSVVVSTSSPVYLCNIKFIK